MNTPATPAPWLLCDSATRTAIAACDLLNKAREQQGLSLETLAARSGLSVMTVTRAMQANGCNLAEFLCLTAAMEEGPCLILADAIGATNRAVRPLNVCSPL